LHRTSAAHRYRILKLTSVLRRFAYRLRSHVSFALPLSHWAGLLLLAGAVAAFVRWWPSVWLGVILVALFATYVFLMFRASRTGYVRFVHEAGERGQKGNTASREDGSNGQAALRASGWFTTEGNRQYFAEISADVTTTVTGERIVMGRVPKSRFLLVGHRSRQELGWWYIFVQPEEIRDVELGRLLFGLDESAALRLVHRKGDLPRQTTYISSMSSLVLEDLYADIRRDLAPVREEHPGGTAIDDGEKEDA
jgi:hypothetical protein